MIRRRAIGLGMLATMLSVLLVVPTTAAAQAFGATGRPGAGGHYHEGEIGEVLLLIERNIRCNCSCGLDVHSCQFQMQCDVSPGWTQRIMAQLEAGESPEAIEAGFVADFGGGVLMAPPAEGFNLVGYLLPSVAIVMAGMLIGLVARGRAEPRVAPVRQLDEADTERLRNALRQLDESEGPDW